MLQLRLEKKRSCKMKSVKFDMFTLKYLDVWYMGFWCQHLCSVQWLSTTNISKQCSSPGHLLWRSWWTLLIDLRTHSEIGGATLAGGPHEVVISTRAVLLSYTQADLKLIQILLYLYVHLYKLHVYICGSTWGRPGYKNSRKPCPLT